jgi:predicted nucleic acid-binding protein
MRVALDTNVLAYAEGMGDEARHRASLELVRGLPVSAVVVPAQCLGELFRVLTGKGHHSSASAKDAVLSWADAYEVADSTWTAFQTALDIVAEHNLQIWDALILAVTLENHCRLLLSEDMQHGFTWRSITVVNPYVEPKHRILQNLHNT